MSSHIFVDTNNTVYAINTATNQVLVWLNNGGSPIIRLGYPSTQYSIFVSTSREIYVSRSFWPGHVDKWTWNTNTSTNVMNVSLYCFGLFIDISNTLYCSMGSPHQVIKRSLNDSAMTTTTIAGSASPGSGSNQLNYPLGIFVDINFDLYVADSGNNRIQLFPSGELDGITVAGNGSSNITITLYLPSAVVLDADHYLFIADTGNHRIIGSGPYGFRCLVGCSGSGSGSNQLNNPTSLSFDIDGNLFVADWSNNRIQKFILMTNSCGMFKVTVVKIIIYANTFYVKKIFFSFVRLLMMISNCLISILIRFFFD